MKKNRAWRAAALLCLCAIATTGLVGGTLAKYVASGDIAEQSARVAKFGVTITPTSNKLFKTTYAKDDSTTTVANTVVGSADVVAPGTSGTITGFSLSESGREVAVRVSYSGTVELGDGWQDATGSFYFPVSLTIGTTTIDGGAYYGNKAGLTAAISEAFETAKADYGVGTAISGDSGLAVSWSWAFTGGTNQTDERDTFLGNNNTGATITVNVKATVTQID